MSYGYFDFTTTSRTKLKIVLCEAQNWRCCYCKFKVELIPGKTDVQHAATIEHLLPSSLGGSDNERNLVIACQLCNKVRARGNHNRLELVVLELLKNPAIRAAWHSFDDRLVDLLRKEVRYNREFELVNKGKPSAVRSADALRARHRALVKLVRQGAI